MSEKLNICPFCGHEPEDEDGDIEWCYSNDDHTGEPTCAVCCTNCGAHGGFERSENRAKVRWQMRYKQV